jgi:nicotinate-nucleotide adenylyltransferase
MLKPIATGRSFGSIRVRTPAASAGQRIGIMGGTFNPPHAGHAQVAKAAIKRLRLDRLWWVVTPGNPLKAHGDLPSQEERMANCRALLDDHRIVVTGFEQELGGAYTADTLGFLKRRHPGVRFVWIMGADGLESLHRWNHWRSIAASFPIAVLDRPGYRLFAMASPAAIALRPHYVPEAEAARIADLPPPAWTLLTVRLSPLSSTLLRERR